MNKFTTAMAVALITFGGMTACATFGQDSVQNLGISYVTMKVIDGDKAKAARVVEIAEAAKGWFDNEQATVDLVKEAVAKRLAKLELDPADRLLANALVDAVAAELDVRVGKGLISPEAKVRVASVLDAVIAAAKLS